MFRSHRQLRRHVRAVLTIGTLLGAAVAAGCGGRDPVSPRADLGSFVGRWDGASWRGQGYAVLAADTLYLVGHRPDARYFYDEYVRVKVRFQGEATYTLESSDAAMWQVTGGDAGYLPSAAGEMRVTRYDATAARISGTVRLATTGGTHTWRFDDGTFAVPVFADWAEVPPPTRH